LSIGGIPSLGGPPDCISFRFIVALSKLFLGNSFFTLSKSSARTLLYKKKENNIKILRYINY